MAENLVDVELSFMKSTKGTHVYEEKTSGEPPRVPSLYLPRWIFPDKDSPPESLHITVAIP